MRERERERETGREMQEREEKVSREMLGASRGGSLARDVMKEREQSGEVRGREKENRWGKR